MSKKKFNRVLLVLLLASTVLLFIVQQVLFHDTLHEAGFHFFQDLLFLPIHLIIVTFIFEKVLEIRSKQEQMEHLNILIGAFFTEIGIDVIHVIHPVMMQKDEVAELLKMDQDWTDKDFNRACKVLREMEFSAYVDGEHLNQIKEALMMDKSYLFQLFSNPGLLEHDTFTDMIWALYHLMDELEHRKHVRDLPQTDRDHLNGDIVRVYGYLMYEWVQYMKHLKNRYPYLWSISIRKNPMHAQADIIIRTERTTIL